MEHIAEFVHHHWQLSVAFGVVFVVVFIYEYLATQKQAKSLSVEQAIDAINNQGAVVVDLRTPELYNQGHIIHAMRATAADFKLPKMQKLKDKPIILVCTRGIDSGTMATKLRGEGFGEAMSLSGGIDAWQAAKLSLVKK